MIFRGRTSWLKARLKGTFLLLLILALPPVVPADCWVNPDAYTYRFVNPQLIILDEAGVSSYSRFGDLYNDQYANPEEARQSNNLDEWYERFCGNVERSDIAALLYGRTYNRLTQLARLVDNENSKTSDIDPGLRRNSFARHLVRYHCREVAHYLVYCKRVEPLVQAPLNAFASSAPKRTEMEQLLEEGLTVFRQTESQYVKLRYAYQVIRLAHYLQDYERTITLYEELIPQTLADPSILFYWIEGHRAGALQALGRYAESAYIYSRVFDRCPSRRESAYTSFKIRTDEEWQEALLFCQNEHERATLYVLRAQNPKADLVAEMRSIFHIQADNRALEPLLVREMERLEADFLGLSFNPRRGSNQRYGLPRDIARERIIALQTFVREVIEAGTAATPELWQLTEGYLNVLAGDYFYANSTFDRLQDSLVNDSLRSQLEVFEQVLDILELQTITDSTEVQYFRLLADEELVEQLPDLRKLITDKFRAIYLLDGRRAKALLMSYDLEEFKYNLDLSLINDLLALAAEEETSFDRRLLSERAGPEALTDLTDMRATYYLQRGQLEAAADIFSEIPEENWDNYGQYYPFIPQFHDQVNLRISDTLRPYNKGQFFARMIELDNTARRTLDPDEAAADYFLLGLGHYNMSYFSYNWELADYFRSGTSAGRLVAGNNNDFVFPTIDSRFDNYESMNMEKALFYFEQARRMATDPEVAAKAAYYAAKCERNVDYTQGLLGQERNYRYFQLLQDEYANTQVYGRAVAECLTFAWYVNQ